MSQEIFCSHRLTKADRKLISLLQELPENYWDFKEEDVREYTHGIHNYPAMMVCPISRNIIRLVRNVKDIDTLLDPFSGSGTVLVEGILAGIPKIYGNDKNPFAHFLSGVKTKPLDIAALRTEVEQLYQRIAQKYEQDREAIEAADDVMRRAFQLDLTAKENWGCDAPQYLNQYRNDHALDIEIPQFKNLGYWFKPRVILLLSLIKKEIGKVEDEEIRRFIFAAFSETLRLTSNRRNGEFKMFRMPTEKVEHFEPDVIADFSAILNRNVEKMASFNEALASVADVSQVSISCGDAAVLGAVPDESADLIITSPPYGDSRTTVAYGEYSRLSLQWLDLFGMTDKEILGVDRSLMGGVKYKDGFVCKIPSRALKVSLARIEKKDPERAGDVYSFYLDLERAITTIAEKTAAGGYQFWVVGNRTVKDELLRTDRIIVEIAGKNHLQHVCTIGRNIMNKVMPSKISPTNEPGVICGTMTNEHIVVLRKTSSRRQDRTT